MIDEFLKAGIYSCSVRSLREILKDRGIYPARDFPQYFSTSMPEAFFTFDSRQNYIDIQEIVWKAFDFTANELRVRHPEMSNADFEPMIADGIGLWVDFLFIDQGSRDIRKELDILPVLLENAEAHFVLGTTPLTRSWCCYEIALFNQHCAPIDPKEGRPLRSFIAPTVDIYFGWDLTETFEPEDKDFIRDHIHNHFPGSFEGFNHVMNQANATAVLSSTEANPHYPPAALDALVGAGEKWFKRSISG